MADHSSGDEFRRLLAWAYRGEVSGESLFTGLADLADDAGRANGLRVLAELERLMALALVPLLRRYSVDGGDDERSRRTGGDNAAALAGVSWEDFLTQFEPVTDAALERYRRLREIAPQTDAVFDQLIAHEEALQSFSAAQMRGEPETSLDAVRAVIARLSA